MRLYAGFGLLLAAAWAVSAVPRPEPPNLGMCGGLAAQVRSNHVLAGGGPLLATLSQGNQPYIQLAGPGEIPAGFGSDAFPAAFRAFYRPSERLAAVLPPEIMGRRDVYALPGTPLHMLETTEGTAHCAGFLFFHWMPGASADLLPGLPPKAVADGDNLTCDGFHDDGWLARVGGQAAFLDVTSMTASEDWQVTPWRADSQSWGPACEMQATFATKYSVPAVYVAVGSVVAAASLRGMAAEVVARYEADKDPSTLTFGQPVQGADLAAIQALRERLPEGMFAKIDFPGFVPDVTGLADTANYPLRLGGRAYLMVVGHPAWGWRTAPGTYVVLYAAHAAPLQAAAAAYVTSARGPLRSVQTQPWVVR